MDMEKIVKELEECSSRDGWSHCSECTYKETSPMLICRGHIETILALLKEQESRIRELEEELRALKYGDQDTLESAMMPAT